LQHVVLRRGNGDLGQLDDVGVYAGDLQGGIRRDVAGAVVFAALVDLLVAELCQVGGREDLRGAVAVAREDL
jgi:hypothetical protein